MNEEAMLTRGSAWTRRCSPLPILHHPPPLPQGDRPRVLARPELAQRADEIHVVEPRGFEDEEDRVALRAVRMVRADRDEGLRRLVVLVPPDDRADAAVRGGAAPRGEAGAGGVAEPLDLLREIERGRAGLRHARTRTLPAAPPSPSSASKSTTRQK
jgi:hypothetical protein